MSDPNLQHLNRVKRYLQLRGLPYKPDSPLVGMLLRSGEPLDEKPPRISVTDRRRIIGRRHSKTR